MIKGESDDSYNNLITSVSNQINSLYNDYITKLYEYNNSTSEALDAMEEDNKVKATFFCLVRESEIDSLLPTIRTIQTRFNNKFGYPWIFVSDEEFSDNFKEIIRDKIPQNVSFGVIPKEHWSYPDWIDQKKAEEIRNDKSMSGIPYFNSESYRHMCRYESGFFYRHPLLNGYEYYWRVEPDTQIFCDLDYDVFQWMKDNDKKYGFTLTMREFPATIPSLWSSTQTFLKENPQYIAEDNLLNFISNDEGKTYNMCHFWTNFEIAAIDFWESEAYSKYFEFLDHNGGFFF
ncbi:related to Alpha-1,2 mannosyltransferase KTR1 [Saccharomycodes ludwigii]|uniref:Related to Alpha-1,2 mannosyltransferase KTR1 n=1 Tax=Saccharomycodes ludwigii TaxID=36035 RepID=A0A376B6P6_9ASCO|nr:related to Alpha-1,2 mannosyltransferase KTR1 [Saccharomycodes ludwigii]